jgi:hypothetical protein
MTVQHGSRLSGVERCPQCGIAHPLLDKKWDHVEFGINVAKKWAVYQCTACKRFVLAESNKGRNVGGTAKDVSQVEKCYPDRVSVSADVPSVAKRYLEQAIDSIHAPDGAVMLANSSVDAMLKEKGLKEGTVYERVAKAVKENILTKEMAEWAHKVRLDSNNPRHADEEKPHASEEEAKQTIEFARALGYFLFELTARIERGKEEADKANSNVAPANTAPANAA